MIEPEALQVGRLRLSYNPAPIVVVNGERHRTVPGWFVDHIPSGSFIVGPIPELQQAWVIADDVSRFAAGDLDCSFREIPEHLGPEVLAWLQALAAQAVAGRFETVIGLRAWRLAQNPQRVHDTDRE